jgi:hypothetical protein
VPVVCFDEWRFPVTQNSSLRGIAATCAAGLAVALASPAQSQSVSISPELEILALGFFASAGSGDANQNYFPDYGVSPAYRLTLNVKSSGRVSGRLRYFDYDQTEAHLGLDRTAEFRMLDAEAVIPLFDGGNRGADAFIGLRHGNISLDGSDFGESNPYNFSGTGLTAGAEYRTALNDNLWFSFGGRYSLMMGDVDFQPVSTQSLDSVLLHSFDAFAGLKYNRAYRNVNVGMHAGVEIQYYGTDTYFPYAIDPETLGDTGLAGFSAGVSITF